jgi:rsbT co-antagonist protein RsbR
MKSEFKYIGEKIYENRVLLARALSSIIPTYSKESFENTNMPENDYIAIRAEMIGYIGEVLYKEKEPIHQKVEEWSKSVAGLAITYGISLTESLRILSLYRPLIWDTFSDELDHHHITPATVIETSKKVDGLLDTATRTFGEEHENNSRKLMNIAYTALEELSVPVVPIAEGLAVMPIVGAIDTHRARLIMEVSLSEAARLSLENVIFDISGVLFLDTMVSNALFQIIQALKMIGVETIITGVRPSIAQIITGLGINFHDVKTLGSMQQALTELGFQKIASK